MPDEVLIKAFDDHWTGPRQINMHAMGDEAIEQALRAIERAIARHGPRDHRPVFVHCGYARPDQIARIKAVGGIPSFLSIAMYVQGDEISPMWGVDRAWASNACGSMQRAGIPWTLSHDAPISPPQILPLVWAAVNRVTKSGTVLGPDERVTPYAALRAVTANAAYQIHEEDTKGTLVVGKLADLVILDRNPLKIAPMEIANIKVVQTLKEGKAVFTA